MYGCSGSRDTLSLGKVGSGGGWKRISHGKDGSDGDVNMLSHGRVGSEGGWKRFSH